MTESQWHTAVFHQFFTIFGKTFRVPLNRSSHCCPRLVPCILWDREIIEKRAFSPLFRACPADFANKSQLLGWFTALFGVDRGRNWARLSYKTGTNGVDKGHFWPTNNYQRTTNYSIFKERKQSTSQTAREPEVSANRQSGKSQLTRYSQLSTFGLTFQICEMYEEKAEIFTFKTA